MFVSAHQSALLHVCTAPDYLCNHELVRGGAHMSAQVNLRRSDDLFAPLGICSCRPAGVASPLLLGLIFGGSVKENVSSIAASDIWRLVKILVINDLVLMVVLCGGKVV